MTKLKLDALIEDKPVKMTVELPAATFRDLALYADIMARDAGDPARSIEPAKLIAPMLARFMATDRAFLKRRRGSGTRTEAPATGG